MGSYFLKQSVLASHSAKTYKNHLKHRQRKGKRIYELNAEIKKIDKQIKKLSAGKSRELLIEKIRAAEDALKYTQDVIFRPKLEEKIAGYYAKLKGNKNPQSLPHRIPLLAGVKQKATTNSADVVPNPHTPAFGPPSSIRNELPAHPAHGSKALGSGNRELLLAAMSAARADLEELDDNARNERKLYIDRLQAEIHLVLTGIDEPIRYLIEQPVPSDAVSIPDLSRGISPEASPSSKVAPDIPEVAPEVPDTATDPLIPNQREQCRDSTSDVYDGPVTFLD